MFHRIHGGVYGNHRRSTLRDGRIGIFQTVTGRVQTIFEPSGILPGLMPRIAPWRQIVDDTMIIVLKSLSPCLNTCLSP